MAGERTIKVKFDGDSTGLNAAAAKGERSVSGLGDEVKKTSTGLRDSGTTAARTATDFDTLDRKLTAVRQTVRATGEEILRTGNTKLFGDLGRQERELTKLTNLRKRFADEGSPAASGFVTSFVAKAGPLLAKMPISAPLAAGIGGALVVLAPTIGGIVAGAVVGAAGVGGVVGGVVLASKDPRVKAAATGLKTEIGMQLKDAAEPFVPATVAAIDKARVAFATANTDIKSIFADSSGYLDPLAQGALDGARKFVSGFSDAVGDAKPVVDALGRSLSTIGGAVGDSFSVLADDADEGASALDDLTVVTANFIKTAAGAVDVLSRIKGATDEADKGIDRFRYYLEDAANKSHTFTKGLDLTADGFKKGSAEAEAYRRQTLGIATAADENTLRLAAMTEAERNAEAAAKATADSQNLVAGAMGQAAFVTSQYRNALNDAAGSALNAAEANLNFRQAVDNAKTAVDGKRKVSLGEEQALLGLVRAANASAESMTASGATAAEATRSFNGNRGQLIKVATQMGLTKAEAQKYIDKLLEIPPNVTTKATLNTLPAIAAAKNLQKTINGLHGKTIEINTFVSGEFGADDIGARHGGGRAWGGNTFAGKSYLVGERGPEILTMTGGGSGHITPNGATPVDAGPLTVVVELDGQPFYAYAVRTADAAVAESEHRRKVGTR